jgi:hypothetical protein
MRQSGKKGGNEMNVEKIGKILRLLFGVMLFSLLVYGILNVVQPSTLAVLPKTTPTPTPTPTPEESPTPTPTATPTPPPPGNELDIQIIAQEDQKREKSVMQLCSNNNGPEPCFEGDRDLHAEYKILFAADGVNVDPDTLTCKVVEKEVCHVPSGKTPAQFFVEKEGTDTFDVSDRFVCKFRKSPVPGTGVLDVYFTGDASDPIFIGDHILKVEATKGDRSGAVIQDICILDFPQCRCGEYDPNSNQCSDICSDNPNYRDFWFSVDWPGGGTLNKFADPMAGFSSCKNLAIFQRNVVAEFPVELCFFRSGTIVGDGEPQ